MPVKIKPLLFSLCALLTFACALSARAQTVAATAEAAMPLAVGKMAPTFTLPSTKGSLDLAKEFSSKPTILVFYRGSWCPFCNRQLAALGELEAQLTSLGYQIIAVSPDTVEGLNKMTEKNHLTYRLVSDRAMQVSAAYGVAFKAPAATETAYKSRGIELAPLPDGSGSWLPVPAVFIVGRDGRITYVFSNPDYKVRLDPDALLAAAKMSAAN